MLDLIEPIGNEANPLYGLLYPVHVVSNWFVLWELIFLLYVMNYLSAIIMPGKSLGLQFSWQWVFIATITWYIYVNHDWHSANWVEIYKICVMEKASRNRAEINKMWVMEKANKLLN